MIETRKLTFDTADTDMRLLDGVDMRVRPGMRVGICGPSGSGKTTLAYHLCGVHRKALLGTTGGTLLLEGTDCTHRDAPGFAGLVLQNPQNQLFCRTPREEIALGPENMGLAEDEIARRTERLLDTLGLRPHADRDSAELSLGLQQRVSIASMLAIEPRLLLLDEPTNFLDPEAADSLFQCLSEAVKQRGMTVIVVEHDRRRLREWADHAAILEQGTLRETGPAEHVLAPVGERTERVLADSALPSPPAPDAPIALEVDRVTFAYDDGVPLLHDVSLDLRRGEIVALVGVNGAGKTTLLKLLKGLLSPRNGQVGLPGQASLMDRVGYVFQSPDDQIFAHSVADECGYVLSRMTRSPTERRKAVDDALASVGLDGMRDRLPFALSFGEKRRLTIASVLAGQPDVLCLDEPTVALDDHNLRRLADLVGQSAESGKAVLFATHDHPFAHSVAHRVLELREGRLLPAPATGRKEE